MIQSAKEFCQLRKSSDQKEYSRAANEEAPLEVWLEITEKYPEMRFWVAQNKTVPVEILKILASDKDNKVRSMVAQKRKLSEKLQQQLAKDPDFSVRERLVYNQKITIKTLETLAQDSDARIKNIAQRKIQDL